jgi:hypothetical protein
VSKQLKPILAERPYLLKGSKDLANKLAQLKLIPGKKIFLVSGDIVAFYPNVPRDKCVDITKHMFMDWIGNKQTLAEKHLFSACLRLATRNLIFDFMGRTYRQLQGLAMGVACSPDLANLYGGYYEEQILPIEGVPFFGRFIDDVLAVVYANSAQEALDKIAVIQYDAVEIEYSASEWSMPFLDLLVYVDQGTGQIQHKPYRKARNHLERIPWASSHPKDVKKGTFIGEMSRLATLSSTSGNYLEALDHLSKIYIARGYPPDLIKSWLKDNTQKRWRNRLGKSESLSDVFVLKSHFNPVWSSFNIHELGQIVTTRWLGFLESQDDLNRQLERSNRTQLIGGNPVDWEYGFGDGAGQGPTALALPMLKSDERRNALLRKASAEAEADRAAGAPSNPLVESDVADPFIPILKPLGFRGHVEEHRVLDIRKLGYHERKWLISRKRNFNLADLVSKLKKNVLYLSDHDPIMDGNVDVWD